MPVQLPSAPLLCVMCLLTLPATLGREPGTAVKVFVKEGSDASLPCSLGTQNIAAALFDWRKVAEGGQRLQEVFLYEAGSHYNNGRPGQSHEFTGRVSHFPDELKHGNASILITNTKMADAGNYTCAFPRLQPSHTVYVELVVDLPFKDRSGESSVATPKPSITALDAGETWSLLQCEVRGASPEPTVSWQDSDGRQLPAEEPQVSETGSRYDITLNVTVTKTGRYRCVVEQEAIKHRISSETVVHISEKVCEDSSSSVAIGWCCGCVLGGVIVLAVGALLVFMKCITIPLRNSHRQQGEDAENKENQKKSLEAEKKKNTLDNQANGVQHTRNGVTYDKVNGCDVPSAGAPFVGPSPSEPLEV